MPGPLPKPTPGPIDAPTPGRRVATIDVGTNTIRLLVAEIQANGTYRLLDDERIVARLGAGMSDTRQIQPNTMRAAARSLAHLVGIARGYDVEFIEAIATCAVREASNRDEFLDLVREEAQLDLRVISGDEESRHAFRSAAAAFDLTGRQVAVVDIGGGSTEIVLAAESAIEHIDSLRLGAVRLTEWASQRHAGGEPLLESMRRKARRKAKKISRPPAPVETMIGTGGTFTALGTLELVRRGEHIDDASRLIRGLQVSRGELNHLIDRLGALSSSEREAVPGLSPDRAGIIMAGLLIADAVMRRLRVNTLTVHDRGVRDGVLLRLTESMFPGSTTDAETGPDPLAAARRFAMQLRYEERHAELVTRFSLDIHEQLCAQLQGDTWESLCEPRARTLLEIGAVLHDVGYAINYTRHHRHSYHLISHAELAGLSARELAIVASVARYHRRSAPKRRHPEFRRLPVADQELVRRLAAILRIADGLDRAHAQNVERISVRLEDGSAWFTAEAAREPRVDLWGAARKSELFATVFGCDPRFQWLAPGATAPVAIEEEPGA